MISITYDHGHSSVVLVHLHLDGFRIIAKITEESIIDLGIEENEYVFAIFKASTPQVVREG